MADRTVLDKPPHIPALLVRAALTARHRGGALPGAHLVRTGVRIDRDRLAAYGRVCGFPLTDALPVTYPHTLAFGLQIALMADRSFPLALPGLVHVRNRIEAHRPIRADETLDVEVWAERLAPHRRGATVELCASVSIQSEAVWQSRSTYLARGAKAPGDAPAAEPGLLLDDLPRSSASWRMPADSGRRYAAVSGDVNPIHLSALTAKMFGFRRAVAHGMWVKARCLAALSGRLPDAAVVDVSFAKPLFLPSTVTLATRLLDGGWDFAVANATDGTRHLTGTVRALDPPGGPDRDPSSG